MKRYRVVSKCVVFKKVGQVAQEKSVENYYDDSLSLCHSCDEHMMTPELDQFIEVEEQVQARIYLMKVMDTYEVSSEKEALDAFERDEHDPEFSLCYHCNEGLIGPEFIDLFVEEVSPSEEEEVEDEKESKNDSDVMND